jgi:ribosomal protein S18 acetylase RimI-like enzyme
VTDTAGGGGWQLVEAQDRDLEELMSWFGNAGEVDRWGGPRFRYPFTGKTFRRDCHWGRMPSFRLNSPAREFAAFGQMYERYGRINLARLVVHPDMRGAGVGKRLIASLMEIGPELFKADEFSLFIYRDNASALGCYRSMGFVIRDYPEGAPMADRCYYLTRQVAR